MLFYQILAYTIHEKILSHMKNSYNNNKFKTAPTWNEELELPNAIIFYIRYSKLF